jgi:hypothetical protein
VVSADRELLELAAKAAGIVGEYHDFTGIYVSPERTPDNDAYWNPLTKDGDALRLALTLHIEIDQVGDAIAPEGNDGERMPFTGPAEGGGKVDFAATRRAIVRAAAEIGRGMP